MKKIFITTIIVMALCASNLLAQDNDNDDAPYLSEDDIKSIEATLAEDIPERPVQSNQSKEITKTNQNEIERLNSHTKLYHLVILDRSACKPNADIEDINKLNILYKFKHFGNGYLLLLYEVPKDGPVFPVFPKGSYIILDLMSNRINTIKEYVDSRQFKKFIAQQKVLSELGKLLNKL